MITRILVLLLLPFCAQASSYYWVGGSGNWSDYANHWATTSGGSTFHTQVPGSLDDVFFDANSFTASGQTVTADQTIEYCRDMTWTGVTNLPAFASMNPNITLKVYGSMTLAAGMNLTFSGPVSFEALTTGKTIASMGKTFQGPVNFNGFGGEWTLQDSLHTVNTITLNFGTLRTGNHNIRCANFTSTSNAPRGLFLGTSTVTLPGSYAAFMIGDSLATLDADSSIIRIYLGDFYVFGKISRSAFNLVEFYGTNGVMMDQVYRGTNTTANKVVFHSYGEIRRPSNRIDTLIAMQELWINGYGDIDVTYATVGNDFIMDAGSIEPPDTIQYISIAGDAIIGQAGNSDNFFGKAIIAGNLTMDTNPGDVQDFVYCSIGGDGYFTAGNQFDTLKLTPGRTYTFESGQTQVISQYFDAYGLPGFPIQWVSTTVGTQSTLNLLQPYFCTDYIYVRDMAGTGPGQRYLGANSNDVFNNTGWLFVACSPLNVEEHDENSTTVFPNPASDQLTITRGRFTVPAQAIVTDAQGRVVETRTLSSAQTQVDCKSWAPGIYLLSVREADGTTIVSRVVKQ